MHTRLSRAEVPVESTWSLDDLFVDEAAWEFECQAVDDARQALSVYQGQLSGDAATLLSCLIAVESVQERLMRVSSFAHLRSAQDGTNPQYQAAMARVSALDARVGASTSFVDSEILAFPDDLVEQFMASEPGLAAFKVHLNDLLALRRHRLGADTERVLASLGEVLNAPYMIYDRAKSSDMQFAPFTDQAGTVYANSVNERWFRLSEHGTGFDKWSPAGLTSVQSCPRRRAGVACDERTTDAVGNSCSPLMLPV